MTQSLVNHTNTPGRVSPCRGRAPAHRPLALSAVALLLLLGARPLLGQGQGEVQVTARVLPLVQTREAAITFAANPRTLETSHLFHITRVRRPESARTADLKREELIVVVEFLAN
jgi:hypothetical protein